MRRAAFTLALLLTVGQILPLPPSIGQQVRVAGKRKILSQVKAAYPPLARKMNLTGIVKLVAVVGPDGTVVRTELIGGSPVLVQAAVDAIAKSKWQLGPQETEEIFAKGASVMTPADAGTSGNMPAISSAALDSKPGICPGLEVGGSPKRPTCNSGGVLQRAQPSELRRPVTEQNFTEGRVDPSNPEQFGCACATPDVADANPVIGTGGLRNIQLGIKAVF